MDFELGVMDPQKNSTLSVDVDGHTERDNPNAPDDLSNDSQRTSAPSTDDSGIQVDDERDSDSDQQRVSNSTSADVEKSRPLEAGIHVDNEEDRQVPGVNPNAQHALANVEEQRGNKEPITHWKPINVLIGFSFLRSLTSSLHWGVLFMTCKLLVPEFYDFYFGLICGAASFFQSLSTFAMGEMSKKCGTKKMVLLSTLFAIVSNILAIFAPYSPISPYLVLLVSTAFLGTSTGITGVLRNFPNKASNDDNRPRVLTMNLLSTTVAGLVASCLLYAISRLENPGYIILGLNLTMLTVPNFAAAVLNMLNLFLVLAGFQDLQGDSKNSAVHPQGAQKNRPNYDRVAYRICLITAFLSQFVIANIETIAYSYYWSVFGWSKKKMMGAASLITAASGGIQSILFILALLRNSPITIGNRKAIVTGLYVIILFHMGTYAWRWPFSPGQLPKSTNDTGELIGCNPSCDELPPVSPWLYIPIYLILFPLGSWLVSNYLNTHFTLIIGTKDQTTESSWFMVVTAAGRFAASFVSMELFEHFGPTACWYVGGGLPFLITILWHCNYGRMFAVKPRRAPMGKPGESKQ